MLSPFFPLQVKSEKGKGERENKKKGEKKHEEFYVY